MGLLLINNLKKKKTDNARRCSLGFHQRRPAGSNSTSGRTPIVVVVTSSNDNHNYSRALACPAHNVICRHHRPNDLFRLNRRTYRLTILYRLAKISGSVLVATSIITTLFRVSINYFYAYLLHSISHGVATETCTLIAIYFVLCS